MSVATCFDDYLRSLVNAYQQWWRLYALTDALGRESQEVEREYHFRIVTLNLW
jgi:hypothetical protein